MLGLAEIAVEKTEIRGREMEITLGQDAMYSWDMMLSNQQESVLLTFRLISVTLVHFDIFLVISMYLLPLNTVTFSLWLKGLRQFARCQKCMLFSLLGRNFVFSLFLCNFFCNSCSTLCWICEYPATRTIQEQLQVFDCCAHAEVLVGYEHLIKRKLETFFIVVELAFK